MPVGNPPYPPTTSPPLNRARLAASDRALKREDGITSKPRYSLAHDLLATVRMLVDAYLWPSHAWRKIKRSKP